MYIGRTCDDVRLLPNCDINGPVLPRRIVLGFGVRGSRTGGRKPLRRREFITLFGAWAAAWPLAARAQQVSTAKVGLLWPGAGPPVSPRMESFREGLRRSGYVEEASRVHRILAPERIGTPTPPRSEDPVRTGKRPENKSLSVSRPSICLGREASRVHRILAP
jgi:hypothetical protein